MAKLKGPLLSIDAVGQIGKSFSVSHWKGIKKGMKHFKPKNPRTASQQQNRNILAYAVMGWQALDAEQKESYEISAGNLGLKMSGYNFYLQQYMLAYAPVPPVPPPEPITDGLISWWKFNENQGTDFEDSVGANDGTQSNCAWVSGVHLYCLEYNGSNSQGTVPHHSSLSPGNKMTLQIFVMRTQDWAATERRIISKRKQLSSPTKDYEFMFTKVAANDYRIAYNIDYGGANVGGNGSHNLALNTWYNFAITYDKPYARGYIDGDLDFSQDNGGDVNTDNQDLGFGYAPLGGGWCPCRIDEVLFYNRALSLSEINQNRAEF